MRQPGAEPRTQGPGSRTQGAGIQFPHCAAEEPTLDSLEQMPYADACLRESLRLYPSAATGNREAQRDMILGGAPPSWARA